MEITFSLELPDGTVGGFPWWIADAAKAPEVPVRAPLVSAAALAELHTLLERLRSGAKRDKASRCPVVIVFGASVPARAPQFGNPKL
jgi:hypothetical protein